VCVLAEEIERMETDFPGLLPPFRPKDFYSHPAHISGGAYYDVSGIRSYLATALGKVKAELDAAEDSGAAQSDYLGYLEDPEVKQVVRRITDRFVRLGKGTPQHEVRVKLGPKRHYLDLLVQERVLEQTTPESYLPRLRALDLEDEQTRRLCYRYTEMVLKACNRLYALSGQRQYSIGEIENRVLVDIDPTAETQLLRAGAKFALDLRSYFSGWSASPDGAVSTVTLREEIIDFDSFDTAWALQQGAWIAERLPPQVEPETPQAAPQAPAPQPPPSGGDFSFVKNDQLRRIVGRDYSELQNVKSVRALKSGLVLAGGLIEALLLDALQSDEPRAQNSSKGGNYKGKDLDEWPLSTLIDVAVDLGLIGQTTRKFSDAVRDLRNLVHPGKEIRENFSFGQEEANIADQVLEVVIRDLKKTASSARPQPGSE